MISAAAALTSAFFLAIGHGDARTVQNMLAQDRTLVDGKNSDGASPPLWAVYRHHKELLPLFTRYRSLDFFEACASGEDQLVSRSLSETPGVYAQHSSDGFTPLGLAVFFNHRAIAERLIAAGADVNSPSSNSIHVAPLHSAVASGNIELVRLLLAKGAAVDPVEFLGATPLMAAASEGKDDVVDVLLAAGADASKRAKDGRTAADLARAYNHPDLADRLLGASRRGVAK